MTEKDIHTCVNCDIKTTSDLRYKNKQYCDRCYTRCVEYESDTLRKRYDIRNKDPNELTWYQQAQINGIKEVRDSHFKPQVS
jgi:hypothetical protein